MVEAWLPYGRTEASVNVPSENLLGIIDAEKMQASEQPSEEILRALNNPLGAKLDETAKAGAKAAIVVEDELFPSSIALPPLIDRLNSLGITDSDITLILGRDFQASAETDAKTLPIGEELVKRVKVVAANAAADEFTHIGDTSRSTKIYVRKELAEADLRILAGRMGFHPFAGYMGGRSGILPAACGGETLQRSYALILDSKAKAGNLEENPFHLEMEEAARMAKANFIVDAALDAEGRVVRAFAGDVDQAFMEGQRFLDERFKVSAESAADIVVLGSGGLPWDATLYRACQGLAAALNVIKEDGVIVWVAECSKGSGSSVFYDWMANFKTVDEVAVEVKKRFMLGGDAAYLLLRAMKKTRIILVSAIPDYYATGTFKLKTARTVNAALKSAFKMVGERGKVLVLPHGNIVLPVRKA